MTRCASFATPGGARKCGTRDSILLCVGHNSGNEKLVRIAARLAARLGCHWHAVYVETPSCTGCGKPAPRHSARCGWRRNWEQKPPRWPILPKSARCCAMPASITSANHHRPPQRAALEAARLRRSPRPAGAGSRSGDRLESDTAPPGKEHDGAASMINGACSCAVARARGAVR